ncbi:hypothetical protein D3C81_2333780 [compost metagenome]
MLDSFGQQLIDLLPADPESAIKKFKPGQETPAPAGGQPGDQTETPVPDDTPAAN